MSLQLNGNSFFYASDKWISVNGTYVNLVTKALGGSGEYMKILIDIGHPAHVHFFINPIKIWKARGHKILITSRRKEIATDLLDALNLEHRILSAHPGKGNLKDLFQELIQRNRALFKLVRSEKPDIMTGIGGINIAHVRLFTKVPAIVFYDTENAVLSNVITYPFASLVVTPECYDSWLPPWHLKYPGYHELSYLHPLRFNPSKKLAIQAGLSKASDTFLIRTVSWQASHDISERGWSEELLIKLANYLSQKGKVIISAEGELPDSISSMQFRGPIHYIHHLMAFCRLYVGESATMASECAVLGTPAIYAAMTGRGYTDELESSYGLVRNIKNLKWNDLEKAINKILSKDKNYFRSKRERLLNEKLDVASFVADLVESYPDLSAFK